MERIVMLPFPDHENCFIGLSGSKRPSITVGEKWRQSHSGKDRTYTHDTHNFRTEPYITFTYVEGDIAAEWDGNYGPIRIWYKCEKDFIADPNDKYPEKAREHWIWPYAYGRDYWSQLAVDDNQLPEAFNIGNWSYIFNVLRQFASENRL